MLNVFFCRLKVEADRSFPLASDPRFKAYLYGKGGVIMGDLPPYEAFPIGGAQTVRGYDEGAVGSGRNYVAGSAELHFPIKDPIEVCILTFCMVCMLLSHCG